MDDETSFMVVVQESPNARRSHGQPEGPFLLMSWATYCARYLPEGSGLASGGERRRSPPYVAMREDGLLFRDYGKDAESYGGASYRADWRAWASQARIVTYSGEVQGGPPARSDEAPPSGGGQDENCEACRVEGHDVCSLTPGCACCEDTLHGMRRQGVA